MAQSTEDVVSVIGAQIRDLQLALSNLRGAVDGQDGF